MVKYCNERTFAGIHEQKQKYFYRSRELFANFLQAASTTKS